MERAKAKLRRCALYTRKSSEEGLEQDFNSLHAQREACEAFIRSQRGEGWRLVETAFGEQKQLVAADDLTRAVGQNLENVELACRHGDGLCVH